VVRKHAMAMLFACMNQERALFFDPSPAYVGPAVLLDPSSVIMVDRRRLATAGVGQGYDRIGWQGNGPGRCAAQPFVTIIIHSF
jgi:hypothetical protein